MTERMTERVLLGATAGTFLCVSAVFMGTTGDLREEAVQYRSEANLAESQGRTATAEYYRDMADDWELYQKLRIGVAIASIAVVAGCITVVIRPS